MEHAQIGRHPVVATQQNTEYTISHNNTKQHERKSNTRTHRPFAFAGRRAAENAAAEHNNIAAHGHGGVVHERPKQTTTTKNKPNHTQTAKHKQQTHAEPHTDLGARLSPLVSTSSRAHCMLAALASRRNTASCTNTYIDSPMRVAVWPVIKKQKNKNTNNKRWAQRQNSTDPRS